MKKEFFLHMRKQGCINREADQRSGGGEGESLPI